jgi:hypothetical protein
VSGQVRDGNLVNWPILSYGTKVLIQDYGWAVVQDICPECTPGFRAYAGTGTEGASIRVDLFGPKGAPDLGTREMWIYHGK